MKTVLVTGSRTFEDHSRILVELSKLRAQGFTRLLHGCAQGADSIDRRIEEERQGQEATS